MHTNFQYVQVIGVFKIMIHFAHLLEYFFQCSDIVVNTINTLKNHS